MHCGIYVEFPKIMKFNNYTKTIAIPKTIICLQKPVNHQNCKTNAPWKNCGFPKDHVIHKPYNCKLKMTKSSNAKNHIKTTIFSKITKPFKKPLSNQNSKNNALWNSYRIP